MFFFFVELKKNMFYIIALQGCPYSENCVNKLNQLNIKNHVTWVNQLTKQKYKTSKFNTFPQISFKVINYQNKNRDVFIGGLDDLENLLSKSKEMRKYKKNPINILHNLQENKINQQWIAPILYLIKQPNNK